MNTTTVYQRKGTETLTVMAYIGVEDGDGDEIRVIRTVDGSIVDDRINYHGHGGQQWLREHHAAWTVDGYEMMSSGQDA
jgi:hypothetical protein